MDAPLRSLAEADKFHFLEDENFLVYFSFRVLSFMQGSQFNSPVMESQGLMSCPGTDIVF